MSKEDGGPAFPVPNDANVNGQEGMTLRDYFAAAAAQSFRLPSDYRDGMHNGVTAERAYALADAMLIERVK